MKNHKPQTTNHKRTLIIGLLSMSGAGLFSLASEVQADSAKLVNPATGHAYQLITRAKTWAKAKSACAATGGYLTTITSQAENDWIESKNWDASYPWIGAHAGTINKTWVWSNGEPWDYTFWAKGYPYYGVNEAVIMGTGGRWQNISDVNSIPYICEWELPLGKQSASFGATANGFTGIVNVNCENNVSGQTVQFNKKSSQFLDCKAAGLVVNSGDQVTVNITGATASFVTHQYELKTDCGGWFACKVAAESLGGHLVTLESKEEQDFVFNKFKVTGGYWLGLSDYITEGTFQWVTDVPFAYSNWDAKEPNNFGGAEDCAAMTSNNGKWSDTKCDLTLPAVIEYE